MVPEVVLMLKYFSPESYILLMVSMLLRRSCIESILFLPIMSTLSYSSGTSNEATWLEGLIFVMMTISLMLLVCLAASSSSTLCLRLSTREQRGGQVWKMKGPSSATCRFHSFSSRDLVLDGFGHDGGGLLVGLVEYDGVVSDQ